MMRSVIFNRAMRIRPGAASTVEVQLGGAMKPSSCETRRAAGHWSNANVSSP